MAPDDSEFPQFAGPLVQWPRYGASYRGETFTIAPVPTDDGRWVLSINEWTDSQNLHATVVQAIDAALSIIKDSVDRRQADAFAAAAAAPVEIETSDGEEEK